jgi:hypothetical protein
MRAVMANLAPIEPRVRLEAGRRLLSGTQRPAELESE